MMRCNHDVRRACRGFMLIEILVYLAVLSMALVLVSRLFVTTSRLSLYSTQIVERMDAVREVQRDFLETTRAAAAIVPGIGEHRTDEHTLVLRLHGVGETPRYAVLGMFDGADRLALLEVVREKDALRAAKYKTWRLPVAEARFEVDVLARGVTLALTTQSHNPQRPEAGRTHRFAATLRVDPEETSYGK